MSNINSMSENILTYQSSWKSIFFKQFLFSFRNAVLFLVTFDLCNMLGYVLYVFIVWVSLKGRRENKKITLGRELRLASDVGVAGLPSNVRSILDHMYIRNDFFPSLYYYFSNFVQPRPCEALTQKAFGAFILLKTQNFST